MCTATVTEGRRRRGRSAQLRSGPGRGGAAPAAAPGACGAARAEPNPGGCPRPSGTAALSGGHRCRSALSINTALTSPG